MSHRLIHISFLLLLGIIAQTSSAQSNEAHIQKWISTLSVKRDDQSKQYRAVVNDLLAQDSATHCSLLKQMKENGPSNSPRFQIRLSLLENFLRLGKGLCTGAPEASVLLKDALQKAYEIEDNALLFNVHQGLTALYINEGKFSNAALHAMIAMELAEKLGRDNVYMSASSWYDLGYILFHSREYRGSIAATRKSLLVNGRDQFSGDTLSLSYKMNAWNTIGLAYEKLGIPDSAFFAFDKAMSIADQQKNKFWRGVNTGNKCDVY
jgi:tetratricopeptide (TPR) repeat protein